MPHGALLVGERLQLRAIFAVPHTAPGEDGSLRWTGGVLVYGHVTPAGSEHESGAVFVVVEPDGHLSPVSMEPGILLGGLDLGGIAPDEDEWAVVYRRVMMHAVRFLRMALAYYRYGPHDARQPVGRTPPDRAAANSLKPKKGESLFSISRLAATAGRLGRPPQADGKSWNLAARQEVSGHFKLQPYGPAGSLRKLIWIEAYARGPEDAPTKPKAVRV